MSFSLERNQEHAVKQAKLFGEKAAKRGWSRTHPYYGKDIAVLEKAWFEGYDEYKARVLKPGEAVPQESKATIHAIECNCLACRQVEPALPELEKESGTKKEDFC
jgi:hypothetical protein